jgi:preprotein translocase subunit SecF
VRTLDLVSPRKWFYLLSGIAVVASLVLLVIPPALRPGIEFTSGTTMQLRFERPVQQDALREAFATLGHEEARIQSTGPQQFLIRTSTLAVPEGTLVQVTPTPTATATAGPSATESTVTLGRQGATGDVMLRAVVGGDPCVLGIEAASAPAGTVARVIERRDDCPGGGVYRVQVGMLTGFIAASETHDLKVPPPPTATPGGSPTPEASPSAGATETATPAATAAPTPTATPRPIAPGERGEIESALQERFGPFEVLEFSTVSPVVSRAAVRNASIAVVLSSIVIMAYIAMAFASVPRPVRYGVCAIIATLHDVIIVLGAFSLFGKFFGVEVNLMFITGLLTIIGFSVHDTIVVFDRIRENVRLAPAAPMAENVNAALVQTLGRSLNTSITVLLTILAMLLLGGVTIQSFLLVLLVGIIAGAYSSVGVAAQLLVSWENGEFARLLGRRRTSPSPAA